MSGIEWAHWKALDSICSATPPKSYLEIGVDYGKSLEVVLRHKHPDFLALCDSWGNESGGQSLGGHSHIAALLQLLGYRGKVEYLDGSSHDLLPGLIQRGLKFDLILVDGDHSPEGAKRDLEDCWKLLADGGSLVFDDLCHHSHPGMIELLSEFCGSVGAEIVAVDLQPMGAAIVKKCAAS